MKKYLTILLASFIVGVSVYAFQPATLFIETWEGIKRLPVYTQEQADKLFADDWQLEKQPPMLGTSITTINGSDTLKDSRTTINDNFTALNSGKIEVSTTTLPNITTLSGLTSASALATVGTITSGVWSGTAINVNKGGTGSTTLAQNQVLIGSSTNAISVVSGVGTDGQFLTSQGAGLPPVWESSTVNQGDNYTWTGSHTFNATSTQTNPFINSTSTLPLVAGATTTLHSHAKAFGSTATTTTGIGFMTITHNLGVIPNLITINCYIDGGAYMGASTGYSGSATSTQTVAAATSDGNAYTYAGICYSGGTVAVLWSVSATDMVLYFSATNPTALAWKVEY